MHAPSIHERRRIVLRAVVVMAVVGIGAVGVAIRTLYVAAFDAESTRLAEMAATHAALIEAGAHSELSGAQEILESFGETGELVLARREGDEIVFVVGQRHPGSDVPRSVPWQSALAEPMRRALSGETGTAVAEDYRGERVLAAYLPMETQGWGLVAKIDLSEFQTPFLHAGLFALGMGLLLVIGGAGVIERMVAPLVRAIDTRSEQRVEAETHEREAAEELTRESLRLTRSILDTAVDAIITIDHVGDIHSVNRAATRMFGYAQEELLGNNVRMLMPVPYRREHDGYLESYARTGHRKIIGVGREVPCLRKDGSVFPGELAVSEVKFDERTLFTGVMRDLTERQQSERKLRRAEQRVQAAEELASVGTLVAGLAHEIGTPMGVIQGHAKLLEKHVTNEKAQWRLRTIQEQVGRISRIIQSLLNMARPKASERIPVALEPLVETTLSFLAEKFKRRGVAVVRDFEPTSSVTGDPERLQQLLLNLFLNATDAMPEGGELRLGLRPDGKAGVRFDVADTGTGIPAENLDRIFDAFYTSKEAGKGNGLGLMVASRIVADHGGTIEVESALGQGTAFSIHLPWNPTYGGPSPSS